MDDYFLFLFLFYPILFIWPRLKAQTAAGRWCGSTRSSALDPFCDPFNVNKIFVFSTRLSSLSLSAGPVVLSSSAQLVAPVLVARGTLSITTSEIYFEVDEEDPAFRGVDPKVRLKKSAVGVLLRFESNTLVSSCCFPFIHVSFRWAVIDIKCKKARGYTNKFTDQMFTGLLSVSLQKVTVLICN